MTTLEQQTGTSNERLFWVLPDFLLIENVTSLPPLSVGAKFKVCARSSFDYIEYPVYGGELKSAMTQFLVSLMNSGPTFAAVSARSDAPRMAAARPSSI